MKLGFTLVELALIVALIGILAITTIPVLFDTTISDARTSSRKATVGAVQAGIALYAASQAAAGNETTYPSLLDTAANNSSASPGNPLFDTVLQNGVTEQWFKISGTCYAYDTNGNAARDAHPTDTYFLYTASAGTFVQAMSGCN